MKSIVRFFLNGLAVLLAAYLLDNVTVDHYGYALLVAFVLSLVNTMIRPILVMFTIPLTVLTMGLFLLVINGAMILLVDYFITGFKVNGWGWAILYSIILSIFNSVFALLYK